jgi:hypothetical protein
MSRVRALVLAGLLALSATATNATAHIDTYYGPASSYYGVANQSGFAGMEWNRVYRPVGRWFSLWYQDGSIAYQFERNRTNNPFWHNNPSGYVRSVCAHSDGGNQGPITPTTCQFNHR